MAKQIIYVETPVHNVKTVLISQEKGEDKPIGLTFEDAEKLALTILKAVYIGTEKQRLSFKSTVVW
jgi:hypothetical protein